MSTPKEVKATPVEQLITEELQPSANENSLKYTREDLETLSIVQLKTLLSANNALPQKAYNYRKSDLVDLAFMKLNPEEAVKQVLPPSPLEDLDIYSGFTSQHLEGFVYPSLDPTFVISKSMEDLFKGISFIAKQTSFAPNCLMTGPAGCGKTETAAQFAARVGLPMLKINCALVREPRDWFGYKTAEAGTVTWVKSQFAQAVANGGVVILFDEINRASPAVLNSLLSLLDHTRSSFIEEVKEVLYVGPNTFFFATANIGTKFTGTSKIDAALADRFAVTIPVNYLNSSAEAQLLVKRTGINHADADKLVKIANHVRRENETGGKLSETISTRNLLDAATMFQLLGKSSLEFTLASLFSSAGGTASERAQVLQVIQGQF